ncbi:hypothetical protein [Amycolatopsis suaedae]|nr:hypothetical protein [Amycolatopsis suaedae]
MSNFLAKVISSLMVFAISSAAPAVAVEALTSPAPATTVADGNPWHG